MFYHLVHKYEIKRLVKNGLRMGNHIIIFNSEEDYGYNPHLVSIGNNCVITSGVKFITNPSILAAADGRKKVGTPLRAEIIIHDNCFIGMNAIIWPGVNIGPNSVIGAGAVVMNDIEPNRCVAGNPAKVTCTLQFYERVCKRNHTLIYNQKTKRRVLQQFFWTSNDVDLINNKI
ncbi:MAG: acyltransferase [Acetivibrionales bacterium]|jgi:acetyltransferase-like isoleucine patch superfamily enzyme